MYLVIFPEGTRYNPELKNVITESQDFASKQGAAHIKLIYIYPNMFPYCRKPLFLVHAEMYSVGAHTPLIKSWRLKTILKCRS